MFNINRRLFLWGLGVWLGGTVAMRLAGQHLLHPGHLGETLLLFLISFPLMAWLVRRLCRQLPREEWPGGAISLALPTLLADPFSSLFFTVVFPNMPSETAGLFGGWILWCCAGVGVGAIVRP